MYCSIHAIPSGFFQYSICLLAIQWTSNMGQHLKTCRGCSEIFHLLPGSKSSCFPQSKLLPIIPGVQNIPDTSLHQSSNLPCSLSSREWKQNKTKKKMSLTRKEKKRSVIKCCCAYQEELHKTDLGKQEWTNRSDVEEGELKSEHGETQARTRWVTRPNSGFWFQIKVLQRCFLILILNTLYMEWRPLFQLLL